MLQAKFIDSILQVSESEWHNLFNTDYPFTRHQFLAALEQSGSTCVTRGWQAQHLLIFDEQQLIAALPGYIKSHSYGEYIFDWAWAEAYAQHQHNFYPKIVFAIPFTPATGPRLGVATEYSHRQTEIIQVINRSLITLSNERHLNSWQLLFAEEALSKQFHQQGWLYRDHVQFHWHNHNYQSFDDFLATFTARKRKNVIKERNKVRHNGIQIRQLRGADITASIWQAFTICYQHTYLKRSGHSGYLNLAFFQQLASSMPENILMVIAEQLPNTDTRSPSLVAAALYFHDQQRLYGRYWGCLADYDSLHFECCYYQGIEFCISKRLKVFDAGAQGEHKIQRGFEPVLTHANYRILHPLFNHAIQDYLQQEQQQHRAYLQSARNKLPFKTTEKPLSKS